MPQSFSDLLVHLTFSTDQRVPSLTPAARAEIFPYMGGILKKIGCNPIQFGGVEDHVHLLFALSRTKTVADVVDVVKANSSRRLKRHVRNFSWQDGYGAFSVSHSDRMKVVNYIEGQVEHHKKLSFQEEFLQILSEHNLEFDDRYMWD